MKTKTMKKKLLGFITCLSILISTSCTQTLPGGSNTGGGVSPLTSWSCEIDGVPYSWSGTVPATVANAGQSSYLQYTTTSVPFGGLIMGDTLSMNGNRLIINLFINNPAAATTFNLNPSNYSAFSVVTITLSPLDSYQSNFGSSSFTVNIDTLSSNSVLTAGLGGAGVVTGTFSGKLYGPNLNYINITNGKFRSIRLE